MHRNDLLSKLRNYREEWPTESAMADRLIGFVEDNPDCFERTLQTGHVTGSAWLVNKSGTHVLLTHHRKLDIWVQLGGHADGNPDIQEVATHEAEEESGLTGLTPLNSGIFDIDIHLIPERKAEPAHYHHDIRFAFQTTGSEDYIVSDESHDLAWVDISKMSQYSMEESMLRMKEKWLSR